MFRGQLVLNARGDLVLVGGAGWRPLNPDRANFLYVLEFAHERRHLLLGTPAGLCYFDGSRARRSLRFGDQWVPTSSARDGFRHGPGGMHSYPAAGKGDGAAGAGIVWVVPGETVDRDAGGEETGWQGVRFTRVPEHPTCCRVFRGRSYRVLLATEDPARTPYLNRVVIAAPDGPGSPVQWPGNSSCGACPGGL